VSVRKADPHYMDKIHTRYDLTESEITEIKEAFLLFDEHEKGFTDCIER
jgi:Ca2+-binding EF-hand superfamily protein